MLSVAEIASMKTRDERRRFYKDIDWIRLEKSISEEHHYECEECRKHGVYTRRSVVHHVNHLDKRPDLAYSRTFIDDHGKEKRNLICLCQKCHLKEHGFFAKEATEGLLNEEWFGKSSETAE